MKSTSAMSFSNNPFTPFLQFAPSSRSPPHVPSSVCVMCDFWQRVLEIRFWSYLFLHSKLRAKKTKTQTPQPSTQRPSYELNHWVFWSPSFCSGWVFCWIATPPSSKSSFKAVQQSLPPCGFLSHKKPVSKS